MKKSGHKYFKQTYISGYKHFLRPNKKSIFDELFSFLKTLFKKG